MGMHVKASAGESDFSLTSRHLTSTRSCIAPPSPHLIQPAFSTLLRQRLPSFNPLNTPNTTTVTNALFHFLIVVVAVSSTIAFAVSASLHTLHPHQGRHIHGKQQFYGKCGDTNGDDGLPLAGETSFPLAVECFGKVDEWNTGQNPNDFFTSPSPAAPPTPTRRKRIGLRRTSRTTGTTRTTRLFPPRRWPSSRQDAVIATVCWHALTVGRLYAAISHDQRGHQ